MKSFVTKKDRAYKPRTIEDVRKQADGKRTDRDSFVDSSFAFFRPERDKENQIRVMEPTWEDSDNFGVDIYVHYAVGVDNASYLCRAKMLKEPCPVCEEANRAEQEGDKDYAKKLWAKLRSLTYVINRQDSSKGPLVWAMPGKLSAEINNKCIGKMTHTVLNIDHKDHGRDVFFDTPSFGGKDGGYKYENVTLAEVETPLNPDAKVQEEWLNFIYENPLPELLKFHDYDHIARELNAGIGSSSQNQNPPSTVQGEPQQKQQQKEEESGQDVPEGDSVPEKETTTEDSSADQQHEEDVDATLSPRERRKQQLEAIRKRNGG